MSKPRGRVQTPNGVQGIEKLVALQAVSEYCRSNGLSLAKLKDQKFYIFEDCMIFAQPSDVKPDGLRNDLATQPRPTLVLKEGSGGLQIEATEHTRKYLAN